MTRLSRRQLFAAAGGAAGAAATGLLLGRHVWPLLTREDLVPGAAPDVTLRREAWTESGHRLSFVAVGDNGSGGRQAMAVATEMARTYQRAPFGLVALLGDICYYGNFEDRFEDVFIRPMRPLLDAGVGFELAIGNHDADLFHSDEGLAEIEAELRLLGTPATTTRRRMGRPTSSTSTPASQGSSVRAHPSSRSGSTTRSPPRRISGRSSCSTIRRTRPAGTGPRQGPAPCSHPSLTATAST